MRMLFTSHLSLVTAALLAATSMTHAGFVITYGFDNGLAEQTVNWHGAGSGSTIFGHTNPGPAYPVQATSNDLGVLLHGTGSKLDNFTPGDGLLSLTLTPDPGYSWTYWDAQFASLQTLNLNETSVTFDLFKDNLLVATSTLNFPWEANNGQNEHFMAYATGGDSFNAVRITYNPGLTGNRLGDLHNMDVASIPNTNNGNAVPVPPTLIFGLLGALGIGFSSRIRKR